MGKILQKGPQKALQVNYYRLQITTLASSQGVMLEIIASYSCDFRVGRISQAHNETMD